jgi:hypothetical protein
VWRFTQLRFSMNFPPWMIAHTHGCFTVSGRIGLYSLPQTPSQTSVSFPKGTRYDRPGDHAANSRGTTRH